MSDRSIPGEALVYRIFDLLGESRAHDAIGQTGGSVRSRAGRGRPRKRPDASQSETLATAVQPFAAPLIAEHHAAGRRVVLATTTPYDLIKPLADALGLDDVVATRYGEADGKYDGTINGEFVWGKGKFEPSRSGPKNTMSPWPIPMRIRTVGTTHRCSPRWAIPMR